MRRLTTLILFAVACLIIPWQGRAAVQMSLPDTTGTSPDTLNIPVKVSGMADTAVYSVEFDVNYNPSVVKVIGVSQSNTISDSLNTPTVYIQPGQISVAFAETVPIRSDGTLILLRIQLRNDATPDSTHLTFSHALLNEGTPSVSLSHGKIHINAIHVSPHEAAIFEGDSIQFVVSGDVTPPVQWSLTNTSPASIDQNGMLQGAQQGFTRVIAADAAGLRDTTGNILIESSQLRDLTLTIPDTSYTQTLTFDLPIYISDVSDLDIRSAQLTVDFDDNDLIALDVLSNGTLSAQWGAPIFQVDNDRIRIAAAGTQSLTGEGVLFYIRMRVQHDAYGSAQINIPEALFNEDVYANINPGTFSVISAPEITISPEQVELTNGDTQQFTASGGTPPYTWETNNVSVASIDNDGLLTTHQSGQIEVKVEDSEGFRDSTGLVIINAFRVYMADTSVMVNDSIFYLPIYVDRDVTGLGIYSYEFKLHSSDTSIAYPDSFRTSGTLSAGISGIVARDSSDFISLAAGAATPLSGSDPLIEVRFNLGDSASPGRAVNLSFSKMFINEGVPTVTVSAGSVFVEAQEVSVLLPDTVGYHGDQLTVPVQVTDPLNGLNVTSFEFTVSYDSNLVTGTGVDATGTISDGYSVVANTTAPGTLQVSAAGTTPLQGAGDLVYLNFDLSQSSLGTTPLTIGAFQFNEGIPVAQTTDGSIQVGNHPPVAIQDSITLGEDSTVVLNVLANDYDPDSDPFTLDSLDLTDAAGDVQILTDSTIQYAAPPNYSGEDLFVYYISDQFGAPAFTEVELTIQGVNDPPDSFQLIAPQDSTSISITNSNLDDSLEFQWQASSDPENNSLLYGFQVQSGDLNVIAFPDTEVTSVRLSYNSIYQSMDVAGVDMIQGQWTILVTDGQDTVYASNGPRYLTIDATTVGVKPGDRVPMQFVLHQNYPNPFNPTTTIRYSLPKRSHVTLTIFSLRGAVIAMLIDGEQSAGAHSIHWDGMTQSGKTASNGVYFYQIRTESNTAVRKMVLTK